MGLGLNDWLMLACLPLLWGHVILAVIAVRSGLDKHMAANLLSNPEGINNVLLYLFIGVLIYLTLIALVKASILAMYCRIFRLLKMGR
ncbi:hypothetical protein BT67DRAFT_444142 [Trichocladium antarcticum]|uniref:Rhodopsin domain-containing protein n=1 Tax=Trichocladium antarcticum TaxID=1450529 RepID=A0AAN6UG09_9PEZI|nr:hypothetical protein BT67DRAFT_444142 [Trichocladium antarcticum]